MTFGTFPCTTVWDVHLWGGWGGAVLRAETFSEFTTTYLRLLWEVWWFSVYVYEHVFECVDVSLHTHAHLITHPSNRVSESEKMEEFGDNWKQTFFFFPHVLVLTWSDCYATSSRVYWEHTAAFYHNSSQHTDICNQGSPDWGPTCVCTVV